MLLFLLILLLRYLKSVSFIRVDLPEPDTPVIQVNNPIGILTSKFFKLFEDAFKIFKFLEFGFSLSVGIDIFFYLTNIIQ